MQDKIRPGDKIGILWGGGLGDLMVLRPLLLSLNGFLEEPLDFYTTVRHLPHVLDEMGFDINPIWLPSKPLEAFRFARSKKHDYDLLYLGPYPTLKTRLLAKIFEPKGIWQHGRSRHKGFIADLIANDLRNMGIAGEGDPVDAYGPSPFFRKAVDLPAIALPERSLIVNIGTKSGWQTKQWPLDCWSQFLSKVLDQTDYHLRFVGSANERDGIHDLMDRIGVNKERMSVYTSDSLGDLEYQLANAQGVICHNSGVMHVAVALKIPTLVLTGASPAYWRPPYAWVRNIDSGKCTLECNRYRCPVPFYNARCIRDLSVEDVWDSFVSHIVSRPDKMMTD